MIDTHIHADARSGEDFNEMYLSGIDAAVTCAFYPYKIDNDTVLLNHLMRILNYDTKRANEHGLELKVALGIHPTNTTVDGEIIYEQLYKWIENEDINLTINQLWKRSWSIGLLVAGIINAISWLYFGVRIVGNEWIEGIDFTIYIILQLISAFIILVAILVIQKRKRELLTMDTAPVYVDDDEYWKNGWYNNPNDKRIMVQDRMSTANFTFNLGNPIGKVLNIGLMLLFVVTLVGTCVLMFAFSNSSAEFTMNGTEVKIKAAMYTCEFDVEEIEVIELLDEMPVENFFKTNGGATEDYSIGYFSGNKSGACMLFLYEGQKPILKITLPEKTVFANSETDGEVEQWFEILSK